MPKAFYKVLLTPSWTVKNEYNDSIKFTYFIMLVKSDFGFKVKVFYVTQYNFSELFNAKTFFFYSSTLSRPKAQ